MIEDCLATDLNAVTSYERDWLLEQGDNADSRAPLAGLTVAVKDNICTTRLTTTCGSRMLAGYISPFEATAVTRMRRAGALVACKSNMDEFGMGSSTEYSAYGRTQHPTHPDRVPGGSSGGSAALVRQGVVDAALGSETGGSVRQPASFCGVVGIKPTYGRVSRYGLVAFGSSLDQIGVFARDVTTASRLLAVISGPDPLDPTSHEPQPLAPVEPADDLAGVTIGIPVDYFPPSLDHEVRARLDEAVRTLESLGAQLEQIRMPHADYAIPTYYVIATAEASANLQRYDGVRYGTRAGAVAGFPELVRRSRQEGFGAEVKRRILMGNFVLSEGYRDAYYRQAQRARALIAGDFQNAFASVDLLFAPVTPTPAFRAGEKTTDPLSMYLSDVFTCGANLAGVPAMAIPVGDVGGLPVGGQLIAPSFEETRMVQAGLQLERALISSGTGR